jgi:hypothetical protein
MAEKQAVFTLKVDTGNSVQDVQNFDHAVQSLNKDLQETQATASKQTGLDSFESKLQELDERLKAGGLSMRDMTKLMKEYQNLASAAGQTSPVGQQAIQNAGELKDTIGDLKAATVALSSDTVKLDTALSGIETGAAAFQGVQSAIALTGVESEALVQTMVKLQAAQGLVNAVQTVAKNLQKDAILGIQLRRLAEVDLGKAITQNAVFQKVNQGATVASTVVMKLFGASVDQTATSFKFLKGAIVATGIGAVVAGIAYLAGAFDDATSSVSNYAKAQDQSNEIAKKAIESAANELSALDKLQKTLKDETLTRNQKNKAVAELQKQYPDLLKNVNAEKLSISELNTAVVLNIKLAESRARVSAAESLRAAKFQEILLNEIELRKEQEKRDRIVFLQRNSGNREYRDELERIGFSEQSRNFETLKNAKSRAESLKQEISQIDGITKADQALISQVESKFKVYQEEEKKIVKTHKIKTTIKNEEINYEREIAAEKIKQIEEDNERQRQKLIFDADNRIKDLKAGKGKAELEKEIRETLIKDLKDLDEKNKKENEVREDRVEKLALKRIDKIQTAQLSSLDLMRASEALVAEQRQKNLQANLDKAQEMIDNTQKALDGLKTINGLFNEIDEARLNSIENRREEDLANLDANLQAQLNQEGLTAEQKTKIEEKFAKQKYDVQVKAFAQEEKIKKAQFLRDKAMKLAQVAIDTASAIVKGIAQFGPPPSPGGIAAIASAGIIGVTQALAIANQQYQSGTAPTPPQLGPGGSTGSLTGESASSFTANTNTQTTDLTTLGQGSQSGTSISQVVVLESDITGTQNKVRLQEAKTSF